MANPIKFQTEVSRVARHDGDVATYEFRYLDRRPRYKPGQFLHLALDAYDPAGHWPESRVFTIARGSKNGDYLRLTIAAKGRFTERLHQELSPGRRVWMKGPYGDFIVEAKPERETVLVAGGTGISPFVAFLEDVTLAGLAGDVWLHYGARSPDLLVYRDLIAETASHVSQLQFCLYAEHGLAAGVMPGRLSLETVCASLRQPQSAVYYLCGPQPMVEAFRNGLVSTYGVAPENVRTDEWQ